jgi:hypothetical protein
LQDAVEREVEEDPLCFVSGTQVCISYPVHFPLSSCLILFDTPNQRHAVIKEYELVYANILA